LRIDRFGFEEVLDEHPEISRSLIQQLIRRMRKLAG
jgi:CRP-like cAMP-binding protein